jgi:hypothetical protein
LATTITGSSSLPALGGNRKQKAHQQYTTEWLIEQAKSGHGIGNAALIALTKRNKKKGKEWLRQLHNLHNGKKQLTVEEWRLILGLHFVLFKAADTKTAQLALAWGIDKTTLTRKVNKALESGTHRKKGTDIIENFFYISDVKKIDTKSHRFVGKRYLMSCCWTSGNNITCQKETYFFMAMTSDVERFLQLTLLFEVPVFM